MFFFSVIRVLNENTTYRTRRFRRFNFTHQPRYDTKKRKNPRFRRVIYIMGTDGRVRGYVGREIRPGVVSVATRSRTDLIGPAPDRRETGRNRRGG